MHYYVGRREMQDYLKSLALEFICLANESIVSNTLNKYIRVVFKSNILIAIFKLQVMVAEGGDRSKLMSDVLTCDQTGVSEQNFG